MIWVLINSFWVEDDVEWGIGNYAELIGDAFYAQAFTNSLWLSFGSAFVGLLIASFAAARKDNSCRVHITLGDQSGVSRLYDLND